MVTLTETPTPSQQRERSLLTLGKHLLVAWICALLWGTGLLLITVTMVIGIVVGAMSMGSYSMPLSWACIIGPGLTVAIPILFGYFLGKSKRGLISGLLATPAGIVGLLFFSWVARLLIEVIGYGSIASQRPGGFVSMLVAVPASAVIATIMLISTETPSHRGLGLGLGLSIGLGLSVINGLVLGRSMFVGNNMLHLLWQIPPLIWTSAIYFPELAERRSNWQGFLVWLVLVLVTFVLPFVVVPLFPLR